MTLERPEVSLNPHREFLVDSLNQDGIVPLLLPNIQWHNQRSIDCCRIEESVLSLLLRIVPPNEEILT